MGYLLVVSRSPDIRRVFQYHGAEHMTIHTLEHELPLTVENARRYPTAHPRCGTEFLVVFIIVSIILFSLLAGQDMHRQHRRPHRAHPGRGRDRLRGAALGRQAPRELGGPLAVPARHLAPGHHHQAAGRHMIEVAIASMHEALAANGETAPDGSAVPERVPMPDANELARDMEARRPRARPMDRRCRPRSRGVERVRVVSLEERLDDIERRLVHIEAGMVGPGRGRL